MTAPTTPQRIFSLLLAITIPFSCLSAEELNKNKKQLSTAEIDFQECLENDDETASEDTISCYQDVLANDPKHKWALNNLGYLFLVKGDTAQARRYLDQAINLDSNFTTAYVNRANLLYDEHELQQAYEDYVHVHSLDPSDSGVVFRIAEIHHDRKQYKEAIEWYSKNLKMTGDKKSTLSNRGLVYFQLSMNEKALSDFAAVIKMDPEYYPSYLNRALVYEDQKLYKEALKDLATVLTSSDKNWTQVKALEQRARIYAAQGDNKNALVDLDKALSLDPSNSLILKEKMKVLAKFSPHEKEEITKQLQQMNREPNSKSKEWSEANIKEGQW